jgi:hypothetical protein
VRKEEDRTEQNMTEQNGDIKYNRNLENGNMIEKETEIVIEIRVN